MTDYVLIRDWYLEGGIRCIARRLWVHFFEQSSVAPHLTSILGDEAHEKLQRAVQVGYWPKVREPRSFNEKIMHRKLFDDHKTFAKLSDKYAVRNYVADKVGDDVLTELFHVTDDSNDISFSDLPDRFVMKPNHGSGWILRVWDKSEHNESKIVSIADSWLSETYGVRQKEHWYNEIQPKILFEEYIGETQSPPVDYKLFVFHGSVEFIQVDFDRETNHTRTFLSSEWEPQEFSLKYPRGREPNRPKNLDQMIEIAEKLADGIDFVRVDLYNPESGCVYFGEMTFAPGGGGERFNPVRWDFDLGSLW